MKKPLALFLVLLLGVSAFAGCGGGSSSQPPSSAPARAAAPPAEPTVLTLTFSNATDYIFNEIYISPTASTDWGEELLGSTRVLKSNGSVDVDIPAYDYENYDIMVVDEDGDEYQFTYVPLQNGGEVAIYFGEDGLAADVADAAGNMVTTIIGTLGGGDEGGAAGVDDGAGDAVPEQPPEQPYANTGTGYDTNGQYSFSVFNESPYDIYAIHMGIAGASADYDIDILPQVLPADYDTEVSGMASQGDWLNTEWTLYVTDVDGDTSASYDTFNPWTISHVDINWDSGAGGYVCEFYFYNADTGEYIRE